MSFFSKLFGGSKSEKDVKKIQPRVIEINRHFDSYQSLTNDQLRNKTEEFRQRIKDHLTSIDDEIAAANKSAEELSFNDLQCDDAVCDLLVREDEP